MSQEEQHQRLLDRYELERTLRFDGLGKTWRAIDLKTGSKVDLRMLPNWVDEGSAQTQAKAVSELSGPGIIQTVDVIKDGDLLAFVLEPCDGETIQQRRSRRPRRHFEVSEIKPWVRNMAEMCGILHERGRVHGALQLASFLVEGSEISLTDVAVARFMIPQPGRENTSVLPISSMSPQVLSGQPPTIADDVYALGAVIYELLTGQPVFASGDIYTQVVSMAPPTLMMRRQQLEIHSAPLAASWEAWVAAALSKDPSARPTLADLNTLLRSGQYGGLSTHQTTSHLTAVSASPATLTPLSAVAHGDAPPVPHQAPKAKSRVKIPAPILIPSALLVAASAGLAGIYFGKVKPRNEFKAALDNAFEEVSKFDLSNTSNHEEVIKRWDTFEQEWAAKIESEQPSFSSAVEDAAARRTARERLLLQEKERARLDAEQKRKAYITAARSALDIARLKADGAGNNWEDAAAVWAGFIAKYDVPYEGSALPELSPLITQAKSSQQAALDAIAAEKAAGENFIKKLVADFHDLNAAQVNDSIPVAEKIKRTEALLAACGQAPVRAVSDPTVLAVKQMLEIKLPILRSAALIETPSSPLELNQLFAKSRYSTYSKGGKQRVLQAVQAALTGTGKYAGTADGSTGQKTHDALLAYQKENNLVPSAAVDDATLLALKVADIADDPKPLDAKGENTGGTAKKRYVKKKTPPKTGAQKLADGVKNTAKKVGSAIGGLFKKK